MIASDWSPLRTLGFDDQACLEVAHVVGLFNHLTRMADGFGLQLDAETAQATANGAPLPPDPPRATDQPGRAGSRAQSD